jgi:hypothetical protein
MRKKSEGDPISQANLMTDLTTRQWTDEEIRRAQLRLADEALTKKDPARWLTEMLDILGLLPTNKHRLGRWRPNVGSVEKRNTPMIEVVDTVATDLERASDRAVDTQGHGTLAGYNMHIKRYERPCEHCAFAHELDLERISGNQGITVHSNHTIGYQ